MTSETRFVKESEALAYAKMHAFNGLKVRVIPANCVGGDTVVRVYKKNAEQPARRKTLKTIAAILDGGNWNSETAESIAEVLRESGFDIKQP